LGKSCPIVFPVHPRTQQRIRDFGSEMPVEMNSTEDKGEETASVNSGTGIIMTNPLGYLDFLCLMKHAAIVVTDSGGIQEETTCLKIPCVTVRENTERPVTVENGTNIVAGTKKENIKIAIRRQLGRTGGDAPKNWDGQAAKRIIEVLVRMQGDGA
jgi:UDP-N-acetylglucosamine 2-epimerase (non-hydrolysing)